MFDWGNMTSNQFEELALSYARFKYSEYSWEPTKEKSDDNHDFFYIEIDTNNYEWEGWGEAKHSANIRKLMSREKWDQTIISGFLAKNVRHLMFVTNAQIPIKYILRAECLKAPPYEKFEYINNNVLEDWLYHYPEYIPKSLQSKKDLPVMAIVQKKFSIQFFIIDFFSVSASCLHNVSEIKANKDYLLIAIINSSYCAKLSISFRPSNLISIFPYGNETIFSVNAPIGITCIKSIIRFTECEKINLKIIAFDERTGEKHSHSKRYIIYNNFCPVVLHNNQVKISEQLTDKIKNTESSNRLYALYAPKGAGKTYLLNTILKEHDLYNQIIFLPFTEDVDVCAQNICSLFLCVNFGVNFDKKDYWDNICKIYNNIPDNRKTLLLPELKEIYDGAQKNSSADSLLAVRYIKKHFTETGISLLETGIQKYIVIIIDDVHKIPKDYEELFTSFIDEFCNNDSYGTIIMSGRRCEFNSKKIYSAINEKANFVFNLNAPKISERKQSLSYNFPFIKNIDYFSGVLEKCNSTMLLCILLRKIKQLTDLEGTSELLLQIKIRKLYNEICSNSNSIDIDEFLFYSTDFDIIFPIYAYKSGLHICFFECFNSQVTERIYKLIDAGIIDIQDEYLIPSHDVYQNVFERLCKSPKYDSFKDKTAELFYQQINSVYIDKYKTLYVLLGFGEKYKHKFLEESKELLTLYYQNTEYGKIALLCEKIVSIQYPNIESSPWNKDKLWLMYLYADCLDHCGSLQKSKEYFELVYENGLMVIEDNSIDYIWDAKAQLFNIQYYLLETKGLTDAIDSFLLQNRYKIESEHTIQFETAYLNSLNRRMMVSFLLDRKDDVIHFSSKYYDLSRKLNNNNHIAYYFIDYARGIYNTNPNKALKYMNKAVELLKKLPSEKRRLMDAESEIHYLEFIVLEKSINLLEDVSEQIHQNGYTHMYVNSLLKRAALRIYSGDLFIAKNLLLKINLIFDIEKYPRTKLLFCNLMGGICFLEHQDDLVYEYNDLQNKIAKHIGNSYKAVLSSTDFQQRKVTFNFVKDANAYPLETRLW